MIKILTSGIQTGKTSYLKIAIADNKTIGGFLSPTFEELRYLFRIHRQSFIPFETKDPSADHIAVGRFLFFQKAFIEAEKWTLEDYNNPIIKTIIIDEAGKLELKKEGFHKLIMELLNFEWKHKDLIIVVRDFLVDDIIRKYNLKNIELLELSALRKTKKTIF